MRKLVLGLAMVTVVMGLVGCGNVKDDGFTPNTKPIVENTTETEKEEVVFNAEMSVEEMKKCYNDNEFVGTPRIETAHLCYIETTKEMWFDDFSGEPIKNVFIEYSNRLEPYGYYHLIITDNGTPDDYSDDEIAYIFTTPIE